MTPGAWLNCLSPNAPSKLIAPLLISALNSFRQLSFLSIVGERKLLSLPLSITHYASQPID